MNWYTVWYALPDTCPGRNGGLSHQQTTLRAKDERDAADTVRMKFEHAIVEEVRQVQPS